MKKIYLSPSDQIKNTYAYGNTNEAAQCRKIAKACKAALERCGFSVKTNTADGSNAMYERVNESNAWGADMHVCIHSNAGGGKGAEVYIQSQTSQQKAAAQAVYDAVRAIAPYGSSRGIKTANFYEIKNTKAMCVYLETDFHDNKEIAKWIVNNTTAIGEAIAKGICKYYGVTYKSASEEKTPQTDSKPVVIALPTLRKGSKGNEVKTVQRILRELGYVGSDGKLLDVDGDFGSGTEAAVKRFQKNRGASSPDGIVGSWTWNKLVNQ